MAHDSTDMKYVGGHIHRDEKEKGVTRAEGMGHGELLSGSRVSV